MAMLIGVFTNFFSSTVDFFKARSSPEEDNDQYVWVGEGKNPFKN